MVCVGHTVLVHTHNIMSYVLNRVLLRRISSTPGWNTLWIGLQRYIPILGDVTCLIDVAGPGICMHVGMSQVC